MKYSEIIKPLGLTTEQVISQCIPNETLFNKMCHAKWIKPVVDRNRCRLWDADEVEQCWKRLRAGDYPESA